MPEYAKVVVMGSPITKSNFKMHNRNGRAILPENTGTYHDRYHAYEETIAASAQAQNPGVTFSEGLIAVLRVYYKSETRHPDTNNITKSIFDGIEKSGLIVNDAQIRRLIIEEYYDRVEPRFELELFAESCFRMSYAVCRHEERQEARCYEPASNKKSLKLPAGSGFNAADLKAIQSSLEQRARVKAAKLERAQAEQAAPGEPSRMSASPSNRVSAHPSKRVGAPEDSVPCCSICRKAVRKGNFMRADGGRTILCKSCFKKLF